MKQLQEDLEAIEKERKETEGEPTVVDLMK